MNIWRPKVGDDAVEAVLPRDPANFPASGGKLQRGLYQNVRIRRRRIAGEKLKYWTDID